MYKVKKNRDTGGCGDGRQKQQGHKFKASFGSQTSQGRTLRLCLKTVMATKMPQMKQTKILINVRRQVLQPLVTFPDSIIIAVALLDFFLTD